MKFSTIFLAFAAVGSVVAANGHKHHQHHHAIKRNSDRTKVVTVPETKYEFSFDGRTISHEEVCKGISDGTLSWAPGTFNPPPCDGANAAAGPSPSSPHVAPPPASPSPVPVSSPSAVEKVASSSAAPDASTTSPSSKGNVLIQQNESSSTTAITTPASSTPSSQPQSKPDTYQPSITPGSYDSKIAHNPNTDKDFPDGQLDCSEFPQDYGAIPIDWMKIGGWSGIQYVKIDGKFVTKIVTAIAGDAPFCKSRDGLTAMCSYACPPGFQKSQWPSQQGINQESVGGLMCGTDGKLHLTNPELSTKLCIEGTGNVFVENKLGDIAPICRTDYPGTEGETVPLNTQHGHTAPLTCPDEKSYYQWMNKGTSAEYYLNMKGTPVETACNWSSDGSHVGNWAPVVLGVGTDTYGKTWLSIQTTIQNKPMDYKNLNFAVEIQGQFGGDNACYYIQKDGIGYYCSKGSPADVQMSSCVSYDPNKHPVPGCTVQLMSGKATYVLTP